MVERRTELRMLCADVVYVHWKDETGTTRISLANLRDISPSGACLQLEAPIPLHSVIRIAYPKGELPGTVRYCVFREIGHFIGIEFEPGFRWSQHQFKPKHLLNPRGEPREFTLDPLRPGRQDYSFARPFFLSALWAFVLKALGK